MRLIRQRRPDSGLLLARSMCHELRPPMATLAGLLRALENAPSDTRRREIARLAADHVAYAEAVLGQAAQTASGLAGSTATAVPLSDILPGVAVTAPPGRLTVATGRGALRWPVHPQHTRQILINLVGNAVRHGPPGPVRLRATVRSGRLRLVVCDRGGVTPGLQTAMRRRTPPPDDNGLGLWVVRDLLASLGGRVRARRRFPAGLAVEAVLPRYRR